MTKRHKLTMLKPRIPVLNITRAQSVRTLATPRIQGRAGVRIRLAHLAERPWCVRCAEQGIERLAEELDHTVPLWKGGEESRDPFVNREGLCLEHHAEKTRREAAERGPSGGVW